MNISSKYVEEAIRILREIEATQGDKIETVAQLFAASIADEGLIHVYGSGHSRMGVEEMFPRYGSFPGFHPIIELSTSNYGQVIGTNGIYQSMFLENVEGLAAQIVRNFKYRPNDVFLLFSTSGAGNVVIDMAIEARKRGLKTVGITGVKNSGLVKAKHSTGQKLTDVCDLVIDTCVPVGDAAIWIDGLKYPVGPMSTIANSAIVNSIKVRVAELLTLQGKPPLVITGAQVIGDVAAKETFDAVMDEYDRRSRR